MTDTTPRLSFGDTLRAWLVPDRLYLWDKHRRYLASGEPEIHLLSLLASPERTSLDVGAFKGVYSYALMRYSARVHSFEPNPKVCAILARRLRGMSAKVTVHQLALSNATGTAELRVPVSGSRFEHPRASLSRTAVRERFGTTTICTSRLDDLAIENIGFIKIDAEGFEREVLEGARSTIDRDRPNLLIEMDEAHTGVPLPKMISFVEDLGYECIVLLHGSLMPFAMLDIELHHRHAPHRKDFVNNFIFLPNRKSRVTTRA